MSEFDLGTVKLDPNGEAPRVSVEFGQVLAGGYRLYLWDPDVATIIGTGVNTDNLPDVHPVGKSASQLGGHVISAELKFTNIPGTNSAPDGRYAATISILQGDKHAEGSPLPAITGKLKDGAAGALRYINLAVA